MGKRKSYTLIEVIVAISLAAMLITVIVPNITGLQSKPKQAGLQLDIESYKLAITEVGINGEDLKEVNINKYLDTRLQFTSGVSNGKNQYGFSYIFKKLTTSEVVIETSEMTTGGTKKDVSLGAKRVLNSVKFTLE